MAMAIGLFVSLREKIVDSLDDCNRIQGIVSEIPKAGDDEIGLRLAGHKEAFYVFSGCLYDERIASLVGHVKPGDRVTLYVRQESSEYRFPWDDDGYWTYKIVEASIPGADHIVGFEQNQPCGDGSMTLTAFCGFIMLMSVLGFIHTFMDEKSKKALSKPTHKKTIEIGDHKITLRPDRLTFILTHSVWAIILIALGAWWNRSATIDQPNFLGLACIGFGLYMFIRTFSASENTWYTLEAEGIRMVGGFSLLRSRAPSYILFSSIREIKFHPAFYGLRRDVGTIFIDHGETNSDGDKTYTELIALSNYREIAGLIQQQVDGRVR